MIIPGLARKPEQLRKSQYGRGEKRWECDQGGQVASRLEQEAERAEQKAARTKGLEQASGS